MFDNIKTYFNRGSIINTIEIVEVSGNLTYNFLKAKVSKGELSIVETHSFDEIENLKEHFSNNEAVHLIINTSSILTKIINDVSSSSEAIVNSAFPNIDFSKFNYEILKQNTSSLVCVCRETVVKNHIEGFKKEKILVSGVSLGICTISALTNILDSNDINLINVTLELSNKKDVTQIHAIDTENSTTYEVADMNITNKSALGFSNIMSILSSNSQLSSNFLEVNTSLKNALFNRRFYHYAFRSFVGFLLVLLLCNFFVFNHYYSENTVLKPSMTDAGIQKEQLIQLKEIVDKKESQIKGLYSSSSSRTSYVLDDIAAQVPENIRLSVMNYQPQIGGIKRNQIIKHDENSLIIEGETNNKEVFNDWVEVIESKNYTTQVEILNFSFLKNGDSEFALKVMLKDNAK